MDNGKAMITVVTVEYLSPHLPVSDSGVSGVRYLYLGVPNLLVNYNFDDHQLRLLNI
jgi:hypothetical protein